MNTKGVIMFNRGERMISDALVALYSLRKYYDGDITFYLEKPYPKGIEKSIEFFGCNLILNEERHDLKTLVRKSSLLENPPYDLTLWLDLDTVTVGKIDDMFDYLSIYDADICLTDFSGWVSTGGSISKRIRRFEGIAQEKHLQEALKKHPAINTGILSLRKSEKLREFLSYVTNLAKIASEKRIFIPDETSMQVLYPSINEWGLKCFIAPTKFNASVVYGNDIEDKRIIHNHGNKKTFNSKNADYWKKEFKEMRDNNIANINGFMEYADKRLKKYLDTTKDKSDIIPIKDFSNPSSDVTIVTACDDKYVKILQHTFKNWRKYKNIDKNPVIVFVNNIPVEDSSLDFLRLPNVRIIPWSKENDLDNVVDHREEMLSAFVLGAARYVETEYWIKLDADSYATNNIPFVTEEMKKFSLFSHKWGYSRPNFIKQLDEWGKGHWKRKLRTAKPMLEQGRIEGNRFYHNKKRIISYICLQKTRFTKFCVSLLKERRMPCPSQDTFAYYILQRFNPDAMGLGNFKKQYGFTQGKGKMGEQWFIEKLEQIDELECNKIDCADGKIETEEETEETEGYEQNEILSKNTDLKIDDDIYIEIIEKKS